MRNHLARFVSRPSVLVVVGMLALGTTLAASVEIANRFFASGGLLLVPILGLLSLLLGWRAKGVAAVFARASGALVLAYLAIALVLNPIRSRRIKSAINERAEQYNRTHPVGAGPKEPSASWPIPSMGKVSSVPTGVAAFSFSGLRLANRSERPASLGIKVRGEPSWSLLLPPGRQLWLGNARGFEGAANRGPEPTGSIEVWNRGGKAAEIAFPGVIHMNIGDRDLSPANVRAGAEIRVAVPDIETAPATLVLVKPNALVVVQVDVGESPP